jgi:hypothetical protein
MWALSYRYCDRQEGRRRVEWLLLALLPPLLSKEDSEATDETIPGHT